MSVSANFVVARSQAGLSHLRLTLGINLVIHHAFISEWSVPMEVTKGVST
jgi:hypothetical protein